jgi:hypothetical protein
MNAPEFKTLADPIFNSIINKGEVNMNDQIICETTEEHSHPSTTTISSSDESLGTNVPIQGVSGNIYAPMDTSPTPPSATPQTDEQLTRLFKQLQDNMTAIIQLATARQQVNEQTDLEEAVSVALEQADWFRHRVEEATAEHIENHDFDYEIGNSVEHYMRHQFDVTDHVDFSDLVNDRVDDVIEDMVAEKVQDLLEERLAELLEEKLANANITINF